MAKHTGRPMRWNVVFNAKRHRAINKRISRKMILIHPSAILKINREIQHAKPVQQCED